MPTMLNDCCCQLGDLFTAIILQSFFQGHAAPILYAVWAEAGLFPVGDLAKLRTIDSDLEGHPTPVSAFHFISCE